jgi:hypothetical protein
VEIAVWQQEGKEYELDEELTIYVDVGEMRNGTEE